MSNSGGVSLPLREKIMQRRGLDLDLARRQLGVDVVAARDHAPLDADAKLRAQLARRGVGRGIDVGAEDYLGDAFAVAEIDEDAAAVIAPGGHPAQQYDLGADVAFAECAGGVGAFYVGQEAAGAADGTGRRRRRLGHGADYNAPRKGVKRRHR